MRLSRDSNQSTIADTTPFMGTYSAARCPCWKKEDTREGCLQSLQKTLVIPENNFIFEVWSCWCPKQNHISLVMRQGHQEYCDSGWWRHQWCLQQGWAWSFSSSRDGQLSAAWEVYSLIHIYFIFVPSLQVKK